MTTTAERAALHEWLSVAEAAAYLSVSRQRVDQLARANILDTAKVGGRRLVHRRGLDIWKQQRARREDWHPRTMTELRFKRSEILDLAAHHHLVDVRVFGSVARDTAGPMSDVDLLVAREPGATVLDVAAFATDMEDVLGCTVDVVVDGGTGEAMNAIRASAVAV